MRDPRGEAQCPRCGSTNLTYKNVFDYFKCNDCRITFITPVYSYDEKPGYGLDSAKDVASRIFGEAKSVKPETEKEPEPPATPIRRRRGRSNALPWLITLFTITLLALIFLIAWLIYPNQIADFFQSLF